MLFEEIKKMVDCLPLPSIIIETNAPVYTIAAINKAFGTMTGALMLQSVGLPFFDAFPSAIDGNKDGEEMIRVAFNDVMHTGESHQIENIKYDLFAKNKPTYQVQLKIDTIPLYNENGKMSHILQTYVDISSSTGNMLPIKEAGINTQRIEKRNADLFNFSPAPMWVYDINTLKFLAANKAACEDYGYTETEFLSLTVHILWPNHEQEKMHVLIDEIVRKGLPNRSQIDHVTRSGKILHVDISSEPLPTWHDTARVVVALDITNKIKTEKSAQLLTDLYHLERDVLELNFKNSVVISEVLLFYLSGLEVLLPQMTCIITRVKNGRLHNWASPSLPSILTDQFEGAKIGANVGSCGTAAFLKEKVIVTDISRDKRWDNYKQGTLAAGFRACWSHPIFNTKNSVVGTFAIYYREPTAPNTQEQQIIERVIALLQVILENRNFEEMIMESRQLMAQSQELAQFGNWSWELSSNIVSWSDTLFKIFGLDPQHVSATLESYKNMLHDDDREHVLASILSMVSNKKDLDFEERIIRNDGQIRFLRSWATLLYDEAGIPYKIVGASLDITQSKQIQEKLMISEKRYSDLFHLSPLPMWVYDVKTFRFLDVNEAAVRLYGYSIQEFMSMTILDIRLAEDVEHIKSILNTESSPNIDHSIIVRHTKKNGDIILVNVSGNDIQFGDRRARMVVAVDNTEKIKSRERLSKSEKRFKRLIQEGSDLITVLDSNGKFTYISPNTEEFFGIPEWKLIGQTATDFIHEEDREKVINRVETLKDEKRIVLDPFRIIGRDNQVRWIETIVTDRRADENIAGIITNARDVTWRVLAELKNKQHLDRYNTVAKATSDTIWDYNMLTGEVNWNSNIKTMFGYDSADDRYQWWYDHVHPDDVERVADLIINNISNRESRWSTEYRFRCADGSYKFVFDRGFLIFDEDGHPVRMIGSMQDVTDRLNYIHEIEQQNERLKDIAFAQTHTVRAPLARIMGLVSLLKDPKNDPESMETLFQYLETSATELDHVIKNIISKSKI